LDTLWAVSDSISWVLRRFCHYRMFLTFITVDINRLLVIKTLFFYIVQCTIDLILFYWAPQLFIVLLFVCLLSIPFTVLVSLQ